MAHIVGCVEASELTTCKRGANQHAHIILRKAMPGSKPAPVVKTPPKSETEDMDFAAMKAMLAMDDTTKAYAAGLATEDALKAFIAKSADDQKAEAHAAHAAAEKAAKEQQEEQDRQKAASASVEDRLKASEAREAQLQKRLDESDLEKALRKQAEDAGFDGFPGGTDAVVTRLKSINALPESDRAPLIDGLKSQAAMAKRLAGSELGGRTEEELEKAAPATARLRKKVNEVMEAEGISKADATAKVAAMPAFKKVYSDALAEEGAL